MSRTDLPGHLLQAATSIQERLWDADRQRLMRSFRTDTSLVEAFADDYAYLIAGACTPSTASLICRGCWPVLLHLTTASNAGTCLQTRPDISWQQLCCEP